MLKYHCLGGQHFSHGASRVSRHTSQGSLNSNSHVSIYRVDGCTSYHVSYSPTTLRRHKWVSVFLLTCIHIQSKDWNKYWKEFNVLYMRQQRSTTTSWRRTTHLKLEWPSTVECRCRLRIFSAPSMIHYDGTTLSENVWVICKADKFSLHLAPHSNTAPL